VLFLYRASSFALSSFLLGVLLVKCQGLLREIELVASSVELVSRERWWLSWPLHRGVFYLLHCPSASVVTWKVVQ
jgi:hypothetical protein